MTQAAAALFAGPSLTAPLMIPETSMMPSMLKLSLMNAGSSYLQTSGNRLPAMTPTASPHTCALSTHRELPYILHVHSQLLHCCCCRLMTMMHMCTHSAILPAHAQSASLCLQNHQQAMHCQTQGIQMVYSQATPLCSLHTAVHAVQAPRCEKKPSLVTCM